MTTLKQSSFRAFDLETTGVDPLTAEPVSFALVSEYATGDWYELCKPSILIPEQATAVHGITDEMVGDSFTATVAMYRVAKSLLYSTDVVVGMNLVYDLTILHRYQPDILPLRIFDVLVVDRYYDKFRKGSRKLIDLCKHYGVQLNSAHNAAADARVCLSIARIQIEAYKLHDEESMQFTDKQAVMYEEWISNYSAWRVKHGQEAIPQSEWGWPIR